MRNPIPYGRQDITDEDISFVIESLKSDYLTQGPRILEFESKFAEYVGCSYAVAVSNGTAALHLSALAIGVQPGDKVITTPLTFAASANCIRYCGGEVIFSDIDEESYLIDLGKLRELLEASPLGTYRGIVPVDFSGRAVNLEKVKALADEFNLWIIEDACHAPGGYFLDSEGKSQYCGNGVFADLSIFSFHPVKHIATGEGGMITTNNENLYKKLLNLRTHGITKDVKSFENPIQLAIGNPDNPGVNYPTWYMEMQDLGYNYRITDIQAALGVSQLKRADNGLEKRRHIAERYFSAFKEQPYIKGQSGIIEGHAYHLYIIEVEDRLGLYDYLRERNIYSQIHYFPTHLMPYYRKMGWKVGDFKVTENYYGGCLSLPMFPTLKNEELDFIIETIDRFYREK